MRVCLTLDCKNCESSHGEWMPGISIAIIAVFDNSANEDHMFQIIPECSKLEET